MSRLNWQAANRRERLTNRIADAQHPAWSPRPATRGTATGPLKPFSYPDTGRRAVIDVGGLTLAIVSRRSDPLALQLARFERSWTPTARIADLDTGFAVGLFSSCTPARPMHVRPADPGSHEIARASGVTLAIHHNSPDTFELARYRAGWRPTAQLADFKVALDCGLLLLEEADCACHPAPLDAAGGT